MDPNAPQHSDFLRGFHGSGGGQTELDAAWNDIHPPPPPQLDHIYDTHPHPQQRQPILDGNSISSSFPFFPYFFFF